MVSRKRGHCAAAEKCRLSGSGLRSPACLIWTFLPCSTGEGGLTTCQACSLRCLPGPARGPAGWRPSSASPPGLGQPAEESRPIPRLPLWRNPRGGAPAAGRWPGGHPGGSGFSRRAAPVRPGSSPGGGRGLWGLPGPWRAEQPFPLRAPLSFPRSLSCSVSGSPQPSCAQTHTHSPSTQGTGLAGEHQTDGVSTLGKLRPSVCVCVCVCV